ncbi:MAG: hypothetical protein JNJ81_12315, partial [Candidatus Accumulibacter sp.]|nr:hypothetical protein [Accumulibacter sp.]
RMRFQLTLQAEDELRFQREKLREIVLARTPQGYQLSFWLAALDADAERPLGLEAEMPEYVVVHASQSEETPAIQQATAVLP